jgi:hypothetical protein
MEQPILGASSNWRTASWDLTDMFAEGQTIIETALRKSFPRKQ